MKTKRNIYSIFYLSVERKDYYRNGVMTSIMLSALYCGLINLACVYFGSSMATDDEHFLFKVDNLVYGKLTNPIPGEGDYVLDSLQIYMEKLNETMEVCCLMPKNILFNCLITQKRETCNQ